MEESFTKRGGNILTQFAKLLLGIFGLDTTIIYYYSNKIK